MKSVIIDNGSHQLKTGFTFNLSPSYVIESLVGIKNEEKLEFFFSPQAIKQSQELEIKRPIKRGMIRDFDLIEKLWEKIIFELKVDPKESPFLLSESLNNTFDKKEKMMQIFYEKFDCPFLSIFNQSLLSFFSNYKINGAIINCG